MKKQTMKNSSVLVIAFICLLGLTGCGERKPNGFKSKTEPRMMKASFEGHDYIIWSGGGYKGGITHSPDCACGN